MSTDSGFSNSETRTAVEYLENDEGLYRWAVGSSLDAVTMRGAFLLHLDGACDALEDNYKSMIGPLLRQLLRSAVRSIDWPEIVDHFKEYE